MTSNELLSGIGKDVRWNLQDAALQNGDKRLQDGQSPTGLLVFLEFWIFRQVSPSSRNSRNRYRVQSTEYRVVSIVEGIVRSRCGRGEVAV